jgi:hypothetical protein
MVRNGSARESRDSAQRRSSAAPGCYLQARGLRVLDCHAEHYPSCARPAFVLAVSVEWRRALLGPCPLLQAILDAF